MVFIPKKIPSFLGSGVFFGIFFLLIFGGRSIWAESAQGDRLLYREFSQSPLAYLRLPLPWLRQELSEPQKSRLGEKMLGALLPGTGRNFSLRALLSLSKGPLELSVLPPENQYLPIPSFILRVEGNSSEIVPSLEQLVMAVMSEMQGSPATWVKFNESAVDKNIRQAFLLGGHVWLVPSDNGASLYFSSNIDFLKKINGQGANIEEGKGTGLDDVYLFLDLQNAMRNYASWLKHSKIDFPFESLTSQQGWSLGQVMVYSFGKGSDFEMRVQGRWANGMPNLLEKTKDRKNQMTLPISSSFFGSMCLPHLTKNSAQDWIAKLPLTLTPIQITALSECYSCLGDRISFAWPENCSAPLIRLELSQPKAFEESLSKLLDPQMKILTDPEGRYRSVVWPKGELSYRIQDGALYFSPLLQTLKDTEVASSMSQVSKEDFVLEYPLEGHFSGNYYALCDILVQCLSLGSMPMSPNDAPAFSSFKVVDQAWHGKGEMIFKSNDKEFQFQWKQPYGIGGLLGGLKLQSSGWIYFLTLLQFTKQSF